MHRMHRGFLVGAVVSFLVISLPGLSGCFKRSIEVKFDDLPALSHYDEDHPVSVVDQGEQVIVEPRFDPELHFVLKKRSRTIAADLEHLKVDDGKIRLKKAHVLLALKSYRDITLSPADIRSIKLSLSGHVPPGWDPKWGLVFWLLGPGGYLGMGAQWYATDWVSLDAGTSWVLDTAGYDGIGGFVGFRFLPVSLRVKPYIGASTSGFVFFKSTNNISATVAGRVGVDIEFYNNRMLFRWELNVQYFLNKSGWPVEHMEKEGNSFSGYLPWTGFAVIVML
jgi:hypothetical protein